jgi:hypothetical protein
MGEVTVGRVIIIVVALIIVSVIPAVADGRKWCTNGIEKIAIHPDAKCPYGWWEIAG